MRLSRHTWNHFVFSLTFFCAVSFLTFDSSAISAEAVDAQESHPGISRESRYAEAVIAYNKRKTDEALKILDELLKDFPDSIQYLELKALALKGKGEGETSFDLYTKLYQAKPEKERGPYAFEIAMILDKAKKTSEAKPYFLKAIELGFNEAASYLYLGLGAYNATYYAEAERYFSEITGCGIPDIELIAQYYASLCYFKLNFSTRGVQELVDANDLSAKILKSNPSHANAKNILAASNKMLSPFASGQWFGTFALLTQYDSNVQQLPAATINTVATPSTSSLKQNFLAHIGYMTPAKNTFQLISGYRNSYNLNFNRDTKGFQYFSNNLSLFVNYRPLARTTYSVKLESNYVFEYSPVNPSNPNSEYEHQKYNFTYGGGFAIRHQLDRYWRIEGEFNYRNQIYYVDSSQSGENKSLNLSIRRFGGGNYFNPGLNFLNEDNHSRGRNNRYNAKGFGISNSMNLPYQITLNQNIDVLFPDYEYIFPKRHDKNLSFRVGGFKLLTPKISLLGDISFIRNISSNSAIFTYNRFLISTGVNLML